MNRHQQKKHRPTQLCILPPPPFRPCCLFPFRKIHPNKRSSNKRNKRSLLIPLRSSLRICHRSVVSSRLIMSWIKLGNYIPIHSIMSRLFHFIFPRPVPSCFIPFRLFPFYSIPFNPAPFYCVTLHCISLRSTPLHLVPLYYISFRIVLFYSIPLHSIPSYFISFRLKMFLPHRPGLATFCCFRPSISDMGCPNISDVLSCVVCCRECRVLSCVVCICVDVLTICCLWQNHWRVTFLFPISVACNYLFFVPNICAV